MKNWKFDLFEFKQNLTLDQLQISSIVEGHLQQFDRFSEIGLTQSLTNSLKEYSYDNDVKGLLESFNEEISSQPLVYELKDLYKRLEMKNQGHLHRQILETVLNIINEDDDASRMNKILSELALYDWEADVKNFVISHTSNPVDVKNMTSGGAISEKVYTVVESVEGGHVAFIGNRFFLLSESEVKEVILEDVIKDKETLKTFENLAQALSVSSYGDMLEFPIDENLSVCLNMEGELFINEEKADAETTLEDLFNSPVIPYMKKNYYELIKTVTENLDKIVDLDVVCKVSNPTKSLQEMFIFNHGDGLYLYNVDKRTGSTFYKFESVSQLVNDVQKDMGYDISDFVKNKLSKEVRELKVLEDKEMEINTKLKEIQESMEELTENTELLKESAELKDAYDMLLGLKHDLLKELNDVKNDKVEARKRIS